MWIFCCIVFSLNGLVWYLMNEKLKEKNEEMLKKIMDSEEGTHFRFNKFIKKIEEESEKLSELEKSAHILLNNYLMESKITLRKEIEHIQSTTEIFLSDAWKDFTKKSDQKREKEFNILNIMVINRRQVKVTK